MVRDRMAAPFLSRSRQTWGRPQSVMEGYDPNAPREPLLPSDPGYQEPGLEPVSPEDWIPNPKALAAATIAALKGKLGTAALGGMAGIIRKGGDPNLVAIHQMNPKNLAPESLAREIMHPSIAINRGPITQDFGALTLVARPGALDPKNVGGEVYNRDIFSKRRDYMNAVQPLERFKAREYSGMPHHLEEARQRGIAARLRQSFGTEDPKLKEAWAAGNVPLEHQLAVKQAKSYPSYAAFEADPRGARLLGEYASPQEADETMKLYGEQVRKLMEAGDMEGAIRLASKMPSSYAEQKVRGPLGLHGERWIGAFMNPYALQEAQANALSNALKRRGIPLYFGHGSPTEMGEAARAISEGQRFD